VGPLARLADLAQRRGRAVLVGTAVLFVAAVAFGAPVAGILKASDDFSDPDSENVVARKTLERASGAQAAPAAVALVRQPLGPEQEATVAEIARIAKREPLVVRTISYYDTRDPAFLSRDRSATYVAIVFRNGEEDEIDDAAGGLREDLGKLPDVSVGGEAVTGDKIGSQVGKDLGRAEGMAFPLLFIASLFVFRGVVAALMPLFVGVITIFTTFLMLRLVNEIVGLSVFALNMVIALGLGLAIDYSLFVVSRYREELARAGPGPEAMRRTLATAGRTILYSALTVAVALAALTVFPQRFLYSMGIGGIATSLIALTTALVALPALLAVLGPRINSLSTARWRRATEHADRDEREGFWYRLSHAVTRRPGVVAAATAAVLIAAGTPVLGIEFTSVDARVLPREAEQRQVAEALETEFAVDRGDEISIAVEAPPAARREVEAYAAGLGGLRGVAAVEPPRPVGAGVWEVNVLPRERALSDTTLDLVREIRDRPAPFPAGVTGEAAQSVDQRESFGDRLPIALAVLSASTVALLFAMTGSIVLPLKSLVMNLLSLSAAFGLLVLIFQDGRFEWLLDFDSRGALDMSQPVLLFALAFGLSTDYAVFLLTRIREVRRESQDDDEAVALGLQRTGRIVTAAALLFSIAIGAFATSEIVFIKEVGVGTALAVLIDATIVRALLVPSLMAMLGPRNWWAPGPLRRLHARLRLGEA
jgi:RND superfamily putative drug exporter